MVAYSFKTRFAAPILAGTKRQTIRADRKRHARPGEELQLYTGMRTKHCKLIGRAACVGVYPITIGLDAPLIGETHIQIRRGDLTESFWGGSLDGFARWDGFKDWADMRAFWKAEHPGADKFQGMLITWGGIR